MKKRVAVLSVSFTILIYMVITVAVAGLTAAFPDVPEETLLLVVTLPNLTGIPAILITPLLLRRMSQKAVTVSALALTVLGGAACLLFSTRLWVLLTAAVVLGFAYGMVSTMYPLLVTTHFTGHERVTIMGLCAGMLQLGRLVAILLGGFLANIHWSYIYFTFIFVLAALVVVLLWLPTGAGSAEEQSMDSDTGSLKNSKVWRLGLLSAFFGAVYFLSNTHASLYVEGLGLGTAATTGAITSITCVAAVLISSLYSRLPRWVRDHIPAIVFGLMGAGYLLAGLWVSLGTITAALLLSTAAIALFNPWFMLQINTASGRSTAPVATAMVLILINIGYFASPYFTGALALLTGGGTAQIFLATGLAGLVLVPASRLIYRT